MQRHGQRSPQMLFFVTPRANERRNFTKCTPEIIISEVEERSRGFVFDFVASVVKSRTDRKQRFGAATQTKGLRQK